MIYFRNQKITSFQISEKEPVRDVAACDFPTTMAPRYLSHFMNESIKNLNRYWHQKNEVALQ
jgi:hypothetical protein